MDKDCTKPVVDVVVDFQTEIPLNPGGMIHFADRNFLSFKGDLSGVVNIVEEFGIDATKRGRICKKSLLKLGTLSTNFWSGLDDKRLITHISKSKDHVTLFWEGFAKFLQMYRCPARARVSQMEVVWK